MAKKKETKKVEVEEPQIQEQEMEVVNEFKEVETPRERKKRHLDSKR